jgi:hypothetical protein
MPAPLYARYIPSATTKSTAADSDPSASSTAPKPAQTLSKPLKEKKTRSKVDKLEGKPPRPVEEDTKHSKKRKRNPIEQKPNPDEENDGLSKRHGAILAKYQRSSKISEKIRERKPSPIEEEDSQKEPTPELHGNSVSMPIFEIENIESNSYTKTSHLSLNLSNHPNQITSQHSLLSHHGCRNLLLWDQVSRSPSATFE